MAGSMSGEERTIRVILLGRANAAASLRAAFAAVIGEEASLSVHTVAAAATFADVAEEAIAAALAHAQYQPWFAPREGHIV